MSLIKRRPSPAQRAASRANSRRSTGPRSARGRATSSRNALKPRPLSSVIARAIQALGGRRRDFELAHQALAQAMQPRDAWEMAWVQDIAILRWRLQCLQRAEVGAWWYAGEGSGRSSSAPPSHPPVPPASALKT